MNDNIPQQSRRTFLKAAGTALVGAAGLSIVGCAPKSASEQDSSKTSSTGGALNIKWDEEYDVVVAGAGAAGMAAALTVALEGNGATCLLAEKADKPDGNTPFAKGTVVFATDEVAFSNYMKEMAGDHSTTPDEVLNAYAKGATENFDWIFNTLGAPEDEASVEQPSTVDDPLKTNPEYPEFEHCYSLGKFTVGGAKEKEIKGPKHVATLLENKLNENSNVVTYRTKAPLEELIKDPADGRIVGAIIDGKAVHAKLGVIMCTGGFENNPTMMENYVGMGAAKPAAGNSNTGDGHKACMKIGADFWHMEHVAGFWMSGRDLANERFTNNQIISPSPKKFGITVGVNGRRWYMDWDGYSNKSKIAYKDDISLAVGSRHGHMNVGGAWPHITQPSKAWFVFDQAGLEAGAIPTKSSSNPVADKYAVSANSIEELAAAMKVPADELTATVDQWNECCATGKDVYFHRPADTLQPVSNPPFYAQIAIPAFLNTDGGPVRNDQGQILDPDGKVIPGLYSAGEFGSIWSGVYQGGGNVAECLIFGRISARTALASA